MNTRTLIRSGGAFGIVLGCGLVLGALGQHTRHEQMHGRCLRRMAKYECRFQSDQAYISKLEKIAFCVDKSQDKNKG